ncbi:MAG: ParA family protein [Desulfovibrio sp.]|nr:ParA family protein [Desulfovibrio sp.]
MSSDTQQDRPERRRKAFTVSIACQKGGVGKTSTALALCEITARKGMRVLLADMDAQGNASYTARVSGAEKNALAALQRPADAKGEIQESPWGFHVLASVPALANADAIFTETGREYRLQEALRAVEEDYDIIVVDTPPSLGILTVNALTACRHVVIPTQADMYSVQGLRQLGQTVEAVRRYCNPGLAVSGVLVTRYNGRTVIRREVSKLLEDIASQMGSILFSARVRECTAMVEAQATRTGLFVHAPSCNASVDYQAFADELLQRIADKEES